MILIINRKTPSATSRRINMMGYIVGYIYIYISVAYIIIYVMCIRRFADAHIQA